MRTEREAVQVAARSIGLLLLALAHSGFMVLQSFLLMAAGGYLLRGAPALLDWGYREPRRTSSRLEPLGQPPSPRGPVAQR